MPDTIQSFIIGAVSGVLSAVLTYYSTRAKSRLELTVAREMELHKARVEQYLLLWPHFKVLARYGRDEPVTHAVLAKVSALTRDWYYGGGGLYLTSASREPYFRWKRLLQALLDDPALQARPTEAIEALQLQAMVDAIGDLHTTLSEDLEARRRSLL
jgi:hypothetical protein